MSTTGSDDRVTLVEVSPRDGLQNEKSILSTATKATLVRDLVATGLQRIEVTSFVHPRLVPQMADAEAVVTELGPQSGAFLIGLVLNRRGVTRALATKWIDEINYVVPATDSFGRANQGVSTKEALADAQEIAALVRAAGRKFSVTIAVAFGCPYEGEVEDSRLAEVVEGIATVAPDELALADTIGCAVPADVRRRIRKAAAIWTEPLRLHFHDTRRAGIGNVDTALENGIRTFDSSAGGIGGCPFAPGAAGNVATEDILWMLERTGMATSAPIDAARVTEIGKGTCRELGCETRSAIGRAGAFPMAV
ncbi:hydroxymethylglutaryl-CoA lyase [Janibacter hoylei]|uniref:hydroxymethylglutaryl-CoA lyase n=1 Tax=Janibacter hoylei TaxID=364298 RepID=UPI002490133D|nr:hydroxymethylglutaryl-CoA lyase [Janibacter hoylei]